MRWFSYFLITLALTYAAEWAPYYVQVFNPEDIQILDHLSNYEKPCDANPVGNVSCRAAYQIPKTWYQLGETFTTKRSASVGLGIILYATDLYCPTTGSSISVYGDIKNAGKDLSSLNSYQSVPITSLECTDGAVLRAWAPTAYRRYGNIDAPSVVGSIETVNGVKRLVEFMRRDLFVIVAVLFLSFFVIGKLFSKLSRFQLKADAFEQNAWAWAGVALLNSGLIAAFLPIQSDNYIFARLNNFFYFFAMVGTLLNLTSKSPRSSLGLRKVTHWFQNRISLPHFSIVPLFFVSIAFVLSPYFAKSYSFVIVTIATAYIALGLRDRSLKIILCGVAFGLDGLKVMMVPYLPTSINFSIFILFIIADRVMNQVKEAVGMISLVDWAHGKISSSDRSKDILPLLEEIGDKFNIGQLTLCRPIASGQFEISRKRYGFKQGVKQWSSDTFLNAFPSPIFSHVLTTQEPLWHVEQDSLYALNLRKGEQSHQIYDSPRFTVLPLIKDSVPVGAIGLTHYPEALATETAERVKLQSVMKLLLPMIGEAIQGQVMADEAKWRTLVDDLAEKIHAAGQSEGQGIDKVMQKASDMIAQTLDCGVFIAQLNQGTRQLDLLGLRYDSPDVEKQYRSSQFYAVSHNEQGPIALATNHQKCVTVPNTDWILDVLHPMSVKIFKMAQTRSCAAIPIFTPKSDADLPNDVWGLLFLESSHAGTFTGRQVAGLEQVSLALSSAVKQTELAREGVKTRKLLQGFIPSHVVDRLVASKGVREEELGYLLMADIRDSTKISRAIGSEKWNLWVNSLVSQIDKVAGEYGFKLQAVVWDAFFLTKEASVMNPSLIPKISELAQKLNTLFYLAAMRDFPDLTPSNQILRSRFCLVYGDITRDVTGSFNSQWTIVGTAMASVHKLEQACKGDSGWFFTGIAERFALPSGDWQMLEKRVQGTDEIIIKLNQTIALSRLELETKSDDTAQSTIKKLPAA